MKNIGEEYAKRLTAAIRNKRIKMALERAIASYRKNVEEELARFPHTLQLAEEVRMIKEASISKMEELVKQAMDSIKDLKGEAYLAKTENEARRIIGELAGSGRTIVKSKSLTSEEVGLREYLEELGNKVYETDLGELIIQFLGIKPTHLINPSIHVPREDVAELLTRVTGKVVPPEISREVEVVRQLLREKFVEADIGISGANVVAAETGSLVVIENEGNARLSTGFPPIHIAIVGVEKVVQTFSEAMKVAEVTWRYATGRTPSYVNIISGPSKTADIEKTVTYGVHGPKEFHVVFLDNGRFEAAENPLFREALYCLRCGACLYECPVFALTAGEFGEKYFGGIGAVWTAIISGGITGNLEGLASAALVGYTCLTCGRCKVKCPVKIDIPNMIIELRKVAVEKFT
ncbi:TPA: lactate utilization protein [Candidatus Bathyarchaeota archaeon]|nr:lactate utilization protein [Candidatus Bathyarchaeota archaeon]